MQFTAIDIVFALLVVFTTIRAGVRGFVREFMSMAAVGAGVLAAVLFSAMIAELIVGFFGSSAWSQIVAFLGIFVLAYAIVKLFEKGMQGLVERIHLESLDHALGLFLGVAEGLLLTFVAILVIQVQPFIHPEQLLQGSAFARLLLPFLPYASEFITRRTQSV
ncbi:MAG: CvpA family protein [Spirochaetes bacterium]|jgi:membrane protein required for colicin V production|nr:CvpA family protein [Spirochaetota bacterium]